MQTLRASDYGLSIALLSPAIVEVIDTLTKAGYEAYIVGGSVRDLLLGLHPKDFDAVTNATPSQIRETFGRRCRIIGRRFELAHVFIGRDMIEVATFRAPPRQAQTISGIRNCACWVIQCNALRKIQCACCVYCALRPS